MLHSLMRHSSMQITMDFYANIDDALQDVISALTQHLTLQTAFLAGSNATARFDASLYVESGEGGIRTLVQVSL